MKRIFFSITAAFLFLQSASATLYLEEVFPYGAGNLAGQGDWSGGSGSQVGSGSLAYAGLQNPTTTSNKASLPITASTALKSFNTTAITNGSIFISFILKQTTLTTSTAGGTLAGLDDDGTVTTSNGKVAAALGVHLKQTNTTSYVVGIRKGQGTSGAGGGTDAFYSGSTFASNDVVFIVAKYLFGSSAGDDTVALWVNPDSNSFGSTEPTPNIAATTTGNTTDAAGIQYVFVRCNSSTISGLNEVDNFRAGSSWAEVTPPSNSVPPVVSSNQPVIMQTWWTPAGLWLRGTNGTSGAPYQVVCATNLSQPPSQWVSIATNTFDSNGNFDSTNPIPSGTFQIYYRLMVNGQISPIAPSITTQPTNQTATAGQNVSFDVAASGTAPLSYQWFFNTSTALANETNSTLTLNSVSTNDAGSYSAIVTNVAGSATSAVATLTVNTAPTAPAITTQPTNQTVTVGQNVTFNVGASGTASLKYQWYFNTNTVIANATNSSLTLNGVTTNDAGGYSVIVTNNYGSATSAVATLTVNPAPVAPSITTQPTNQTVTAGQNATFNVAATGTAPLKYQWYFNTNTVLASATNSSLTISNAQIANAGGYSVRVTNTAGSVTSVIASLTVSAPPSITTQPTNQTVTVSNNVTFVVGASGTAPLRYQWYFNTNTPLASATNSSLTITSAQTNDAGGYSVIVTNSFGAATSSIAVLTVNSNTTLVPGAYFVSTTDGNDSNPGTLASPFKTISKGLSVITSGGVVYVRAGTYALTSKLSLSGTSASAANTIRLWAYPGETPVVDNTGMASSSDGIGISGKFYHLKGLEQKNAGHNGINISGHSNTVENCIVHGNTNTGLHITGGNGGSIYPSYNLILNCDAYLNYDPPIGGNADGFSAKWSLGAGNVFRGCRAWWNSDDGWDLWMGTSPVLIEDCWAFWNGTNYWASGSFDGNGNGFKLGGNYVGAPHRLLRSLAFRNVKHGIDQNNNITGMTIDNNTSWANGSKNYYLSHSTNTPPHVVRNNLGFAGASGDTFNTGTLSTNNSWQVISPAPNSSDVQGVNDSTATSARQADGSLPVLPFLRPVSGGRLIDEGINIGEPYSGAAPDLGAYEVE